MFDRIRAAWRAFWNATTAPVVQSGETSAAKTRQPVTVSHSAMAAAHIGGGQEILPETIFAAARPMDGIVPDGLQIAMDSAPGQEAAISYALQSQTHEGLGFLGYPYLAELSQRAEYRHVAAIWAEYATRKWIKITGDEDKVHAMMREMDRLGIRALYREAIERECFFGRMHLHLDFNDWSKPVEQMAPLVIDAAKINPKRPLVRVSLVEPMWAWPGIYSAQNPLAPDFYHPSTWYVSGSTVHTSRLLTLVSNPMPNMLKPAYAFGGVSMSQKIKPYVDNWLRTRQSASDLVHSFSIMVLKTDMDDVLQGGSGDGVYKRVDLFNRTRDNRGTFVLDKDREEFENVAAPIAGLDKLVAQSLEQISAISGIPLSILLGVVPTGLNASTDGEIRTFYDKVLAYNEKVVGPGLDVLFKVIQLSLFGEIDPDMAYEFESLWEMSDADKAAIRKSDAEADRTYVDAGVISNEEVRDRLNDEEGGMYHGRLEGPPPEPEPVDDLDADVELEPKEA